MHRAGAAQPGAAAVFGAGQADVVADDPQQRCGRLGVEPNRWLFKVKETI